MLSGTTNGDGFGLAWYNRAVSETPAVYASISPIWADYNLNRMTDKISSDLIFAHVRGASEGMPVAITNTHPFTYGRYTFMHNGSVDDFRSKIFPQLLSKIRPDLWNHIKGNTDSEHLFGYWLSEMGAKEDSKHTVDDMIRAMESVLSGTQQYAESVGTEIVANLAVSDGENIIATRFHHGNRVATLYYAVNSSSFPDSIVIASERFSDDPSWKTVPEKTLVILRAGQPLELRPLR